MLYRLLGLWSVAGAMVIFVTGCANPVNEVQAYAPPKPDYTRPLAPGELALRRIPPSEYPDFGRGLAADREALAASIRHSLDYLAKPSSRRYFPFGEISHARAVASLERFLEMLKTVRTPAELNRWIHDQCEVYQSVGCDGRGTVYFTGYYCPIFDGRRTRSGEYRYPLYGLPPDLVKDEEGRTLGRRQADGGLDATYPTRQEIEQERLLDGLEVAWLKDPFEVYIATVQGSAKLRLADGSLLELGYAGNNGHPYTPIAEAMIADGVIQRSDLSLQRLRDYFAAHPERVYEYAWRNDRYVFFVETPGGPYGSLNTPVTPYHTIATDKEVFPRACLAFMDTALPRRSGWGGAVQTEPYAGFALDQDTGGAIRAAGRSDVFMGTGPAAEALAGRAGAEGALYYLFVKGP